MSEINYEAIRDLGLAAGIAAEKLNEFVAVVREFEAANKALPSWIQTYDDKREWLASNE